MRYAIFSGLRLFQRFHHDDVCHSSAPKEEAQHDHEQLPSDTQHAHEPKYVTQHAHEPKYVTKCQATRS